MTCPTVISTMVIPILKIQHLYIEDRLSITIFIPTDVKKMCELMMMVIKVLGWLSWFNYNYNLISILSSHLPHTPKTTPSQLVYNSTCQDSITTPLLTSLDIFIHVLCGALRLGIYKINIILTKVPQTRWYLVFNSIWRKPLEIIDRLFTRMT